MRSPLFLILALTLLLGANAPDEQSKQDGSAIRDDQTTKDQEAIQGTWVRVSVTIDGKDATATYKDYQSVFRGDKRQVIQNGQVIFDTKFKLDAAKTPKTIDIYYNETVSHGIYDLKDGKLILCFPAPGKERPKDFTSKPGTGYYLNVLRREPQVPERRPK